MTSSYASVLDVVNFLELDLSIPEYDNGVTTRETVIAPAGGSTAIVYLAHTKLISGTYTFSYGASASSAQTNLTETTHYTIDKTTGAFALTAAGVTAVGANGVYAVYKYISQDNRLTDAKIQDLLDRMQSDIDFLTSNHFADGSVATPDYVQITEEKHDGQGNYNLAYYLDKYPIVNVYTQLNGAVLAGATTITVDSTAGFPSVGSISIGSDRIDYTGKSATTFTGCTGALAHDDDEVVNGWVVEISNTIEGTTPVWSVIEKDVDYDIDFGIGRIQLLRDNLLTYDVNTIGLVPKNGVPNRFRFTGLHGHNTIPADIKQLLIKMVVVELYDGKVGNALNRGTNGFVSEGIASIISKNKELISRYTNVKSDNI